MKNRKTENLEIMEFKNRWTASILFSIKAKTEKEAVEKAIKNGANLHEADLYGANLYEADLHGANLCGADLHGANLCGADLRGADLYGANLYEADLHGANLCGADLHGANLYGTDLRGADLRGADLCGADLCGADLCGADLDFSAWPLSCNSLNVKVGDKIAAQLFFHWARLDVSQCSAHIRYMHRFIIGLFGKSMANWFCKFRSDTDKI